MTNEDFAAAFREALHRKKITQGELAKQVGVHQSTISRWLAGEDQPRGRHLQKLARVLEAPHLVVGAEGVEALDEQVLEKLLAIMRRIVVGQGGVHAVERELPGLTVAGELKQRLLADTPKLRAELNEAAGGDFERLTETEQRRILDQVATGHVKRARAARALPKRDGHG